MENNTNDMKNKNAWDILDELAGTVEAPENWSTGGRLSMQGLDKYKSGKHKIANGIWGVEAIRDVEQLDSMSHEEISKHLEKCLSKLRTGLEEIDNFVFGRSEKPPKMRG